MTVNYRGNILQLQAGDVVLFRNNLVIYEPVTFLSAAVRLFTQFQYNHCAAIVENQGLPFVSEALSSGVISRPAEKHLVRSATKIMVIRPKDPVDPFAFTVRANSRLGTQYDYQNLLVNQPIYRTTGKWTGPTQERADEKMVCSEFVAWAHRLPNWWMYSTREVYESGKFTTLFNEMDLN